MGYRYVDHTADLAVQAWGPTVAVAFVEAARALTSAMVTIERVSPTERRAFEVCAASLKLLLVEWLSWLVAEKDTSGLVFCRFEARVDVEAGRLEAEMWGEPLDPIRHEAALEVKGISLLGLAVRQEDSRWVVEYVADV